MSFAVRAGCQAPILLKGTLTVTIDKQDARALFKERSDAYIFVQLGGDSKTRARFMLERPIANRVSFVGSSSGGGGTSLTASALAVLLFFVKLFRSVSAGSPRRRPAERAGRQSPASAVLSRPAQTDGGCGRRLFRGPFRRTKRAPAGGRFLAVALRGCARVLPINDFSVERGENSGFRDR